MDQMRETPSTEWLAQIASMLRAGKVKLNDLSAIPGLLAEKGSMISGKLGDVTIGDTPHEIQNWAEGNIPLELTPGSRIPRFKRDAQGSRAAAALEAAGFLPVGTVLKAAPLAAKGAMMIPIAHNVEAVASKATDLAKRARLAAGDLQKGATPGDIWHDYGVSEIPRGNRAPRPTEHGRFMYEIPDQGAKFSPYALGNENDKIDALMKANPTILSSTNKNDQAIVKQFMKSDLPISIPGQKLGDVLEHPELFESQPWMKEIDFNTGKYVPGTFGSYTARAGGAQPGTIELSTTTNLEPASSLSTPLGTTTHEMMHGVQDKYYMPGGGSPSRIVDPARGDNAAFLVETIMKLRKKGDPAADRLSKELENIINQKGQYSMYRNLLGEQQSRGVQERLLMTPSQLANTPLTASYDNLSQGIDADVMNMLARMRGSGAFPTIKDPTARADLLVHALRSKYGAP